MHPMETVIEKCLECGCYLLCLADLSRILGIGKVESVSRVLVRISFSLFFAVSKNKETFMNLCDRNMRANKAQNPTKTTHIIPSAMRKPGGVWPKRKIQ